jgi:hypothetical protein
MLDRPASSRSLPPPRRRVSRRVRRRRALAALVVLALIAAATVAEVRTHQALHRNAVGLREEQAARHRVEGQLAVARARDATATASLRDSLTQLTDLTSDRNQAVSTLDQAKSVLRGALDRVGTQNASIGALQSCLHGVQSALNRVSAGDRNNAIFELAAVAGACQTAQTAVDGPTDGSVYPFDFPDPSVVRTGDQYWAYATTSAAGNVQVLQSNDLSNWKPVADALPVLPAWAEQNSAWAPSVVRRGNTYVLYYTVGVAGVGHHCVSRAVSNSPQGPFVDDTPHAMICALDRNGTIDPSPFVDADGSVWLLYKTEDARIWSQRMSDDGLNLMGSPRMLIKADLMWENGRVEAPAMWRDGGRLYLFYSANDWNTRNYGIGYAVCSSMASTCRKPSITPLVASTSRVGGPGGAEVFTDTAGRVGLAYHGWTEPNVGYPNSRKMHLATLTFVDGVPVVTPTG